MGPYSGHRTHKHLFFTQTLIKNRSHSTIHTFKNCFVVVFLVLSFQQNKLYPKGPLARYPLMDPGRTYFGLESLLMDEFALDHST